MSTPIAAAPPPDVSAVEEPKNLVVLARLTKPSDALKVIGGWSRMPMPGADAVGEMLAGDSIGPIVDLDQPIDFAMEATPHGMSVKPNAAISAAVKSLDAAKASLAKYKLVPIDNGVLRIDGLGAASTADGDDGGDTRVCVLAPAFGMAATRIICADSPSALNVLAPYLARTAPRTSFPADVHIEGRLAPMRPMVESSRRALPLLLGSVLGMRHSGNAALDDAFGASVGDLADFANDADKIAIDAMLADAQGTVTVTANFHSTTSLLARLASAHPVRAAAPPETFWRLPGDADMAFFQRGIDPKDFTSPHDHAVAILLGALQKEGLAAENDRKALSEAASHTFSLFQDATVFAKGIDLAEAQKALGALKPEAKDDAARLEAEHAALEKVAGWSVMGVDEAPSKVVAIAKEWPAAFARAGVAKWVKAQASGAPAPTIASAPIPKGLTLGKDSAHLVITLHHPEHPDAVAKDGKKDAKKEPKKKEPKPITLHLLVAPDTDGARTWLVVAADEALLVAKTKALLAPADSSSLGKRGGFESMREAKINAGGFVSARGLVEGSTFSWSIGQRYGALRRDPFLGLASSAQQGGTPIPFTFTAQSGAGASTGGTFVATATAPRGAIEDLVHVLMLMMR